MTTSLFDPQAGPGDEREPMFRAPWEASAFAMAVLLNERGLFTWGEWTQALAGQIADSQHEADSDLDERYHLHWLAALESLVAAKGASGENELRRYQHAWRHAALRTPHGQLIVPGYDPHDARAATH